jgi:hypothetical protein
LINEEEFFQNFNLPVEEKLIMINACVEVMLISKSLKFLNEKQMEAAMIITTFYVMLNGVLELDKMRRTNLKETLVKIMTEWSKWIVTMNIQILLMCSEMDNTELKRKVDK